jgi:hypothetical protein
MRGRHSADRAGGAADIAVDMMDNASALPTCPQRQQQEKTAFRKWPKITHTTSRRGKKYYLSNVVVEFDTTSEKMIPAFQNWGGRSVAILQSTIVGT